MFTGVLHQKPIGFPSKSAQLTGVEVLQAKRLELKPSSSDALEAQLECWDFLLIKQFSFLLFFRSS